MTTTPTQPTGHDEAREVLAASLRGDTFEGCDQAAKQDINISIAALSSAGLLATEQEWGVRHSQDIRREPSQRSASEWSEQTNARNADRFDYERRLKTTVVSRRVTTWTEADA